MLSLSFIYLLDASLDRTMQIIPVTAIGMAYILGLSRELPELLPDTAVTLCSIHFSGAETTSGLLRC